MGRDQTPDADDNGIFITPILDQDYCNTDRITLYIDIPGNYTWGKRKTGGRKQLYLSEIEILFYGKIILYKVRKKLRPFIICKAAEFPVYQQPRRNTFAY